jgi:WD40 repeat protein
MRSGAKSPGNRSRREAVSVPLEHAYDVWHVAFSPDGTRLIAGAGTPPAIYPTDVRGEARIWDVSTGTELGSPFRTEGACLAVSFSPNGRDAVVAVSPRAELPGAAYVLDGMTGKPRGLVLSHADGVGCAMYSPNGRQIVTASADTTARIWDASTGEPIGRPMKHRRGLTHAIFSPDGRRVATAGSDGTARVWNAETGEPVSPPLKCEGKVHCVAFSPDGCRLLTASGDWDRNGPGQARLWELPRTDRPAAELIEHGALLSGLRIDHTGALIPVPPDELLKEWRARVKGGISHGQ